MQNFEKVIVNTIAAIIMFLIVGVIVGAVGTFFYWLWSVIF